MTSIQALIPSFTIVILLCIPGTVNSLGLADWRDTTPGGNTIDRAGRTALWLTDGSEIEPLCCWYFYRNSIIGQYKDGEVSRGFFVVNEDELSVKSFESEEEWNAYLQLQNLVPKFWTRWYSYKWSTSFDDILMVLLFGFVYTIPLLILFAVIVFVAAVKEKFSLRKGNTRIIVLSMTLYSVYVLLGKFPQSV